MKLNNFFFFLRDVLTKSKYTKTKEFNIKNNVLVSLVIYFNHDSYLRAELRISCTSVKESRYFFRMNFKFEADFNMKNCLKQIEQPNLLQACVGYSELPSHI